MKEDIMFNENVEEEKELNTNLFSSEALKGRNVFNYKGIKKLYDNSTNKKIKPFLHIPRTKPVRSTKVVFILAVLLGLSGAFSYVTMNSGEKTMTTNQNQTTQTNTSGITNMSELEKSTQIKDERDSRSTLAEATIDDSSPHRIQKFTLRLLQIGREHIQLKDEYFVYVFEITNIGKDPIIDYTIYSRFYGETDKHFLLKEQLYLSSSEDNISTKYQCVDEEPLNKDIPEGKSVVVCKYFHSEIHTFYYGAQEIMKTSHKLFDIQSSMNSEDVKTKKVKIGDTIRLKYENTQVEYDVTFQSYTNSSQYGENYMTLQYKITPINGEVDQILVNFHAHAISSDATFLYDQDYYLINKKLGTSNSFLMLNDGKTDKPYSTICTFTKNNTTYISLSTLHNDYQVVLEI